MLAGHGVDDVHIIIANSLHRKMTAWEMKRMVGQKIFDEFYPDRYYNHDAEWKEGLIKLGETRHKEPLTITAGRPKAICSSMPTSILFRWMAGTNRWLSVFVITSRCARITIRKPYVIPIATWIRRVLS